MHVIVCFAIEIRKSQMRCYVNLEQGTLPFVCLDGRKFMCIYAPGTKYSWLLPPSPAHLRKCSTYLKPANNYTFDTKLL